MLWIFSSVPFNRNQAPLGLHTGDKSRVSSDDKNYLIRSYEEHWTKPMENGMRYHPVFVLIVTVYMVQIVLED